MYAGCVLWFMSHLLINCLQPPEAASWFKKSLVPLEMRNIVYNYSPLKSNDTFNLEYFHFFFFNSVHTSYISPAALILSYVLF